MERRSRDPSSPHAPGRSALEVARRAGRARQGPAARPGGVHDPPGRRHHRLPDYVPLNVVVLPLILSSLFLSPRYVPLPGVPGSWSLVASIPRMVSPTNRTWVAIVVILSPDRVIVLLTSNRRARLGVAGAQGRVDAGRPARPDPALRTAPGAARSSGSPRRRCGRPAARCSPATSSSPPPPRDRLDVAVVDVSGKGDAAATRALLLSGAFGGLITAVPPHEFLDGRQRLPARAPVGRGVRHGRPALARPDQRPLRGLDRRPPAGRRTSPQAAAGGRPCRATVRSSG